RGATAAARARAADPWADPQRRAGGRADRRREVLAQPELEPARPRRFDDRLHARVAGRARARAQRPRPRVHGPQAAALDLRSRRVGGVSARRRRGGAQRDPRRHLDQPGLRAGPDLSPGRLRAPARRARLPDLRLHAAADHRGPQALMRTASYGERALSSVDRLGVWLSLRALRRDVDWSARPRVLDLGCGYEATLLRALRPRIGAATAVDVSLSPALGADGVRAIEAPIEAALPGLEDDSADVVLAISVLEHLADDAGALHEC